MALATTTPSLPTLRKNSLSCRNLCNVYLSLSPSTDPCGDMGESEQQATDPCGDMGENEQQATDPCGNMGESEQQAERP